MDPASSDGAIMPPNIADRLKAMPAPEYRNFVGKLSDVRIGARP